MYAADLRLVTAEGTGRPGVARAAGHMAALLATCLPLGVGLLSVGLASDHRSWYERIAGTRMVSATDDLAV